MSVAEDTVVATDPGVQPGVAATWLSESLLLAVGPAAISEDGTTATLVAGDASVEVPVRCLPLGGANGAGRRKVLTAAVPEEARGALQAGPLSIGAPEAGAVEVTDLRTLAESRLAGLGPAAANQVIDFVASAPVAHGVADARDLVLSSKLHNLRNVLRHRLPAVLIAADQVMSGNVDMVLPIDSSTFFIKGWMRDGEARIVRLTAITPEGERLQLLDRIHRLPLFEFDTFDTGPWVDAVEATRFVVHLETTRPSLVRKPWVFEIQDETGHAAEMNALPAVSTDIHAARDIVLRSVPEHVLPDEDLLANHVGPALDRLQERARDSLEVKGIDGYGALAADPGVSIIVPLYKRIDFVEHQLLQFNRDPELKRHELIYVLDSPELEKELADRAHHLARLYDVPFRVVTMAQNAGFGAATHAGASIARGRLLLFLNSDVLPAEPGWLGRLQAFYDATPQIGALGPKLLYEDDSLQHAGLYFDVIEEGPTAGCWANRHYYKGLHKDLPEANVARPVPAVTAACMMIEQDLYYRAGGLPDVYVQGDYEDSELCLRLIAEGRENWYLPAVELYHLESASYSEEERGITGSYNRWLQTRRIGQQIEEAMARYPRG